jgi:hypothetical protein
MKDYYKYSRLAFIVAAVVTMSSPWAHAANWFSVQGVSPANAPIFGVSGFVEPSIYAMSGTDAIVGKQSAVPNINRVAPNDTQSTMATIVRARLMLRGNLNKYISYFFGGEFGSDGFTDIRKKYQPGLIDGHVTFSYIPGARVEVGLIRAPSAEDAMQGFMANNFVVLPTVIGQLMQQTFYDSAANYHQANISGKPYLIGGSNTLGVNAYRYPGVQAMDWFRWGHWELAYGAMVGIYGSVAAGNQSNSPLVAGRLQGSYIFGGKGPFRSDVTAWVWYQHAQPQLGDQSYGMTRDGIGFQYLQGYMHQWGRRLRFEYIHGSGWISAPSAFSSNAGLTPSAATSNLTNTQLYTGSNNKANGYDIEAGLFFTKRIEADIRYDYYDRLPNNPAQQRIFKTWALGLQYHITPLTKIMAGYYFRSLTAPLSSSVPDSISNAVDNELAMQAMISF